MNNGAKAMNVWEMLDPWGVFRGMRDSYVENSARAMVQLVNTDAYAEASGAMLSMYLNVAEPVREWMEKMMPQVLAYYGLPSRKELLSVASRVNSVEMRLDNIEAALDEIRQMLRENLDPERKPRPAAVRAWPRYDESRVRSRDSQMSK